MRSGTLLAALGWAAALWPAQAGHPITVAGWGPVRVGMTPEQAAAATGTRLVVIEGYQGQQASFLLTGDVLAGEIRSGTARRLIQDWAAEHRSELEANWAKMKAGQALERIRPLE